LKQIFITYIIFLLVLNCKAQNIVPIFNDTGVDLPENNAYLKDVDNDYNPYVGTWKWENGNNSLTIIFNKLEQYTSGDGDYSDLLVGEYQYIENGVELVNTFPLIDPFGITNIINPVDAMRNNNIVSYSITTNDIGFPPCPECVPNTRFIILSIKDPTKSGLWGGIVMARFVENGIDKIKAKITMRLNENASINYSGPDAITVPVGVYTFIKQN
jgi:hypothetical protein